MPNLLNLSDAEFIVVNDTRDLLDADPSPSIIDVDLAMPGEQVSLRAATVAANAGGASTLLIPKGNYGLSLPGTGADTQGDLDISPGHYVKFVGVGAGETIIDATPLRSTANPDRVFEVASYSSVLLRSLTVTGGRAPAGTITPDVSGGGINVRSNSNLFLEYVAVVGNDALSSNSNAGGVYFSSGAGGSIYRSVVTANHAANAGGGVVLADANPSGPIVYVGGTILAKNTATLPNGKDAATGLNRLYQSLGDNRLTSSATGFTGTGDYVGSVDYVVTGIGDSYNHANDAAVLSIRDAIDLANTTAGAQEIWLPGWKFTLTLQRVALSNQTETFVWQGDLDIDQSLTIRGVDNATSIGWRNGLPYDKVFELLGDYNGNGSVDTADYIMWRSGSLAADGDDNNSVNNDDYNLWRGHFGNFFSLLGVTVA